MQRKQETPVSDTARYYKINELKDFYAKMNWDIVGTHHKHALSHTIKPIFCKDI